MSDYYATGHRDSTFRGIIDFFGEIGIYDVVLPFLLIFTIVFAILEKTKVLGVDIIDGHHYTKKPLNAVVAFVVGFLVVASTRLVALINEAMANIVVLLLLSVSFLLLIGSFYREGEDVFLEKGPLRTTFMGIMFVGIILIFLHAIRRRNGQPWLEWFWDYMRHNWQKEWIASIIFLIVIVAFMAYVIQDPKKGGSHGGGGHGHHGGGHGHHDDHHGHH